MRSIEGEEAPVGTWACATCQRINPPSAAACVSCGAAAPARAADVETHTVARRSAPVEVAGPDSVPTLPVDEPAPSSRRRWLIGGIVAGVVLVAAVVGAVVGTSDREGARTTGGSSTTSTSSSSTSVTTASSSLPETTPPEVVTTLPPVTRPSTTTTEPPPVGNVCPEGAPADGVVKIHREGALHIRATPTTSGRALSAASHGQTIVAWPTLTDFDWPRTFIIVRIPGTDRCGWASASNITLADAPFVDQLGSAEGCELFIATTMEARVCPAAATMEVVFLAEPGHPVISMVASPDGGGWKAQKDDVLYRITGGSFILTLHGEELLVEAVR